MLVLKRVGGPYNFVLCKIGVELEGKKSQFALIKNIVSSVGLAPVRLLFDFQIVPEKSAQRS
jgi:hypothetical protein